MDITEQLLVEKLLDTALSRTGAEAFTFEELIKYAPEHFPPVIIDELKLKLARVNEVIDGFSEDDDDDDDAREEWRDRIICLWLHHCKAAAEWFKKNGQEAKEKEKEKNSTHRVVVEQLRLIPSTKSPVVAAAVAAMPVVPPGPTVAAGAGSSFLKAVIPSSYPVYKEPPRNLTYEQEEEMFPKDNYDRKLSKTSLKARMQDAFFEVKIDSTEDIDGLAALLRLISRASKLAEPYHFDRPLKRDLFEYAWIKLPLEMQPMAPKSAKSLSSLFQWLKRYIIEVNQAKSASEDNKLGDSVSQTGDQTAVLCTKCFHLGHKSPECDRAVLPIPTLR